MFDFSGKTLWVTGGCGGIGRAVVKTFFDLGANCVLTDLDSEASARAAREIDPSAARVVGLKQDAGRSADAGAVVAVIRERFKGLDFLVNCAGVYRDSLVAEMTDEEWSRSNATNLDGTFYSCRAAIPLLRKGGAIVNVASMAGHKGSYKHAQYAAAKGAVLTFSRALALELAPAIRVNAVSPGIIETPMVQGLLAAQHQFFLDQTPLRRLGRPEEVAQTIAYLCSDWASFITAETIHINGGLYVAS